MHTHVKNHMLTDAHQSNAMLHNNTTRQGHTASTYLDFFLSIQYTQAIEY